jgi:hypothetical protein
MYNVNSQPIHKVRSPIWIAKKLRVDFDDYGNQIPIYDTPTKYYLNVQTLSETSDIMEFGERVNSTKVISITEKKKYLNKFNEFDLVYINNTPTGEANNGDNADYRIIGIRNQNTSIRVYIQKLVNEQK